MAGIAGEPAVSTVELYDTHGRLQTVVEGAGTAAALTTSYAYATGGELKTVTADAQTRTFTYDGRGLMTSEQHPKLGANGNGSTTYAQFDAKGQAAWKTTGTFDLRFTHDAAARLTDVKKADGTPLEQFVYDHSIDPLTLQPVACTHCKGKLVITARHNTVPDLGTVAVTSSWQFDTATGLPTRLDRAIGATLAFTDRSSYVTQAFNDLLVECPRRRRSVIDPDGLRRFRQPAPHVSERLRSVHQRPGVVLFDQRAAPPCDRNDQPLRRHHV